MSSRTLKTFYLVALMLYAGVAYFQPTPGYMDAAYYFGGGLRLAQGEGFSEVVLWNYLDDPRGLPHPSHGYWMPFTSIVAGLGIRLFAFLEPFRAAQLMLIPLVAVVPALTASLSYALDQDERRARIAGGLALFSGFFLPYLSTTDAFGLYMLLGGIVFLLFTRPLTLTKLVIIGIVAGLLYLTRADGILWLPVILLVMVMEKGSSMRLRIKQIAPVIGGYLLVMGGWFARNLKLFGSPLAPGGTHTLWLLEYNDLFSYPAAFLSTDRWLAAGWGAWSANWQTAFSANLQTLLVVQGIILLLPMAVWAGWEKRRAQAIQVAIALQLLIFVLMTIFFPLPGYRGGYFHAVAALMPMLWAISPAGIDLLADWFARWRGHPLPEARRFFVFLVFLLPILLSAFSLAGKLPAWSADEMRYRLIEERLVQLGASEESIVMINNPPGYFAQTNRPAIVIPDGSVDSLLAAARAYQAGYLVVEHNHPPELNSLYVAPQDQAGLQYIGEIGDAQLYRLDVGVAP